MSPDRNESAELRPVEAARLRALPNVVRRLRHTLRYVDYHQAEADCERLAAALLAAYSRRELAGFRVHGIPRGGAIVLGMLAYFLDLAPEQFSAAEPGGGALLLVDDCALSGARLHRALAGSPASRVVAAHLYSHPDLRQAVLDSEPRIEGCFAAADLADHAPEVYGADYPAWRARGEQHLGPGRYWTGLPDLVCFAWSEPDRPIWNPESGQLEEGWKLLPPHRCLKARARLGPPPIPVEKADWQVADGVVSASEEGWIWLYSLESDQVFSLQGVGAEMWRVLAAWGDIEAGVQHLAARYDASQDALRDDLGEFAATLRSRGLLIPVAVA